MEAGEARTQSLGRPCHESHRFITEGCAFFLDQHGRQVCMCLALLQTEADFLPTRSQDCNSVMPALSGCQPDIRMPWILTSSVRGQRIGAHRSAENDGPCSRTQVVSILFLGGPSARNSGHRLPDLSPIRKCFVVYPNLRTSGRKLRSSESQLSEEGCLLEG